MGVCIDQAGDKGFAVTVDHLGAGNVLALSADLPDAAVCDHHVGLGEFTPIAGEHAGAADQEEPWRSRCVHAVGTSPSASASK